MRELGRRDASNEIATDGTPSSRRVETTPRKSDGALGYFATISASSRFASTIIPSRVAAAMKLSQAFSRSNAVISCPLPADSFNGQPADLERKHWFRDQEITGSTA